MAAAVGWKKMAVKRNRQPCLTTLFRLVNIRMSYRFPGTQASASHEQLCRANDAILEREVVETPEFPGLGVFGGWGVGVGGGGGGVFFDLSGHARERQAPPPTNGGYRSYLAETV